MIKPIIPQKNLHHFLSKSILLIASLVILGCQSTPKNDYDINYDFSQLQSFNLINVTNSDDPLTVQRVKQNITDALVKQGFTQTDNQADFSVSFAFETEEKPKSSGLSIGLGTGSWGSGGGASVGTSIGVPLGSDSAKVQIIQIDIIDPKQNKLIWRGTDKYDFEEGGEHKANKTAETVYHILQQFPPKN
ncbi:DUF4136 domain-containing protein [Shewanella sp. OMA3-2]|uniref:DUF4136 domain-containing protein n=1 Tax=Shewanella sp. OMA3-2 TaxID=2908650 RepID=UPI001F43E3A4|nr:DUF4136 domain-containing protein [Shewanella sp. OMA3-2]UJF23001.1 DUF4136 domain-containing protein [Shewanella sp. OMA3-2]